LIFSGYSFQPYLGWKLFCFKWFVVSGLWFVVCCLWLFLVERSFLCQEEKLGGVC
jgi:hypothetical protein